MTGRAHLRPVTTPVASQPEPIAEERIEWGHQLDPAAPIWADLHPEDRAETIPCRSEGQCPHPRINGYPAIHVRRRKITTEWQEPPHAD